MADQKINTYAWARILDDASPVAAMDDAEFAEFWAGLGRAMRIACLAAARLDVTNETPPAAVSAPFYPDCSTCGHNASGVVAYRCSALVPYPEGDPRGLAGYCGCPCTEDPVVKEWLNTRGEA